jgi:branched-chain amino acid transport system permease protein
VEWLILHMVWLTKGPNGIYGIKPPAIGPLEFSDRRAFYYLMLALLVVAIVFAANLFRTKIGRAFVAIRDQDIAAEAIGVDPARYKVLAFALSSAFVGLAGALTAYWTQILTWERFTLDVSILYLAMIIVGGLGSVSGSVYGAIFIIALPAYLQQLSLKFQGDSFFVSNLPAIQILIFGLTIILFLVFEPKGMARIWERSKDYVRLWPFRY